MRLIKYALAGLAALCLGGSPAYAADNTTGKDASGSTISLRCKDTGSSILACTNTIANSAGTIIDPMTLTGGTVGLVAGSAIVGKAGIDQTTPGTTNGVVVNSSALPSGAATSALQSTIDGHVDQLEGYTDGLETLLGTGNTSLASIDGKLPASLGAKTSAASLSVAPASDATFATTPAPTTTMGCTAAAIASAASTNATNPKASAGALCGGHLVNTTTTIYYLRWYNLASTPTCSSSTGYVWTTPIPPAAASGQAGGVLIDVGQFGVNFSTGIAYCLTGGPTSTDNTSAAVGVYGVLAYK